MRTIPGRSDHVVVVGAGFAGLSAALHLAGRGRQVTVLERAAWPGGRAGRRDVDGYRIDTGPTVLTMPDIIDEAFGAVGESLTERVDLLPLDPAYRAMFDDGSAIDVHTDAGRMPRKRTRAIRAPFQLKAGSTATPTTKTSMAPISRSIVSPKERASETTQPTVCTG